MMSSGAAAVVLRDVTLRDGLQDEAPLATATKVALFEAIVAAGVTELEVGSFVRADRVPAMADTEALCAATASVPVVRWGLVLNERGAERALEAGIRHLQYVVSVSDTHSRHNAGASTDDAMAGLDRVAALAAETSVALELTLATAFGCPYEHEVPPGRVAELAARASGLGVASVSLADTIGVAVPTEVAALIAAVEASTSVRLGVHLHDTRGLGVANALAAVAAGVTRIDGSVGALGGCPFAPGATGNVALEDLVYALDLMGVPTGVSLDGLIAAASLACAAVGRPVGSHLGIAGPRFRPRDHPDG